MKSKFIQIHYLTSYPCSLLNRDDTGFAKRIPFGGTNRTRISSQCLKRHWRTHKGENSLTELGIGMSIRSREIFDRFIFTPLSDKYGKDQAQKVTETLAVAVIGESAKAKKEKKEKTPEDKRDDSQTAQVLVMGQKEIDYLLELGKEICENPEIEKDKKLFKTRLENLKQLRKASSGLDVALFGRMVTNDVLARVDAAIHVAHAFTVHAESTENDYFTAIDDFVEQGSGHLNNSELTSGLYYGYVVVDVEGLKSNLAGVIEENQDVHIQIIQNLLKLIATVSPGAKLGSTAPYSYAHLMLVETGNMQPCTYANAFLSAVKETPNVLKNTCQSLCQHIQGIEKVYEGSNKRAFVCVDESVELPLSGQTTRFSSLEQLSKWVGEQVRG